MRQRILSVCVPAERSGQSVREILRCELGVSAGLLNTLKWERAILWGDAPVNLSHRAQAGDLLFVRLPNDGEAARDCPLVVWQDQDFYVLEKDGYTACHGARDKGDETVASLLGAPVFYPLNRLDRSTSGLMVCGKNAFITDRLRQLLHNDAFERRYLAVTTGYPPQDAGSIALPVYRDGDAHRRIVDARGQKALTEYRVLRRHEGRALVEVRLHTGRTHQIRLHFSALGCPLLGDWLYGGDTTAGLERAALHSSLIRLVHPLNGQVLTFCSALPDELAKFV